MKVSAVIPCYNSAATIERAVKSCAQQSYAVAQIIVVNDGSVDDSLQVLEQLKEVYPTLEVINQKNQGVCVARNHGITAAAGDYILMLDADDFYESTYVEEALKVFSEDKNYGAVMSGYRMVTENKKSKGYYFKPVTLASCLYNNGMHACALFRKKAILDAGMYDPSLVYAHEDWDLNIRILKLGYEFGIVNKPLFNYTQSSNSRSHISKAQDMEMRMYMFDKYKSDFIENLDEVYPLMTQEFTQLRKENKRILNSKAFKISHKMVQWYSKIKSIYKS